MSIDFEVERHRDFITRRGEPVEWHRSAVCPCTDVRSGNRDRQCPLCNGVGYTYTQVPADEIADYRVLVRQVDQRKEFERFGQVYLGDVTLTSMPDELAFGENDLVTLVTRRFRREEVVGCSGSSTDPLHWRPAASIIGVRSVDTEYTVATDVRLTDALDGIEWLTAPPDAGTRVSVVYEWTPRYVALQGMMMTRRNGMPQRVVGQLWGREEFRE